MLGRQMFTGIVLEKCPMSLKTHQGESKTVEIFSKSKLRRTWQLGDSIALNGACLTITKISHFEDKSSFEFDVSPETLSKTNLNRYLESKVPVHLEPALLFSSPIGGHIVTGHIDGKGTVSAKTWVGDSLSLKVILKGEAFSKIAPFLVCKGSITIDGVSLTINDLADDREVQSCEVSLFLIPHTLEKTHFADLEVGEWLNVEADILAKHICRYQEFKENVS